MRLRPMRAREVLAALNRAGWYEVTREGSHAQLKHSGRPGKVTVPVHSHELSKTTIKSIITQAGLTLEEFLKLA